MTMTFSLQTMTFLLVNFIVLSVNAEESTLDQAHQQQLIHLLKQDCGSCHGMTLRGGLGPALLPENLKDKPTEFLKNTILFGRAGTAMPPWQGILTEQEVIWLVTKLQQGIKHEK